jgi:hypothetical protein
MEPSTRTTKRGWAFKYACLNPWGKGRLLAGSTRFLYNCCCCCCFGGGVGLVVQLNPHDSHSVLHLHVEHTERGVGREEANTFHHHVYNLISSSKGRCVCVGWIESSLLDDSKPTQIVGYLDMNSETATLQRTVARPHPSYNTASTRSWSRTAVLIGTWRPGHRFDEAPPRCRANSDAL